MNATDRTTLEKMRRALIARRRVLLGEVEGLETDLENLDQSREEDPRSRAQGEVMAQVLDRVCERDRHEVDEIQRALAKIPAGTYGRCEQCEERIPADRLEAVPAARHCIDCAAGRETAAR